MTVQELNHDGMRVAAQELSAGRAVVLPCSSPLPYAVRFERHLSAHVHRSGINMNGWPDAAGYLADLKRDWQASRAS
jgi:hypothetical protein